MEDNILRIVQLALAINRKDQGKESFIRCSIYVHEDGHIEVKATEYTGVFEEIPADSKQIYYPEKLALYHIPVNNNSILLTDCLQKLENICHELGIDTRERYMKVTVCP